ncbi:collagen alpha-1(III) chain-like [Vulpes lagopus]|uniref:collagen alpha-1(III) chain-like n=1 Tax=Vulpes lagopus TaxID=494514 RepID=UPI001BC9F14B|nr:collagen alpha-1(III) chain-like [Vulpes lagopus]
MAPREDTSAAAAPGCDWPPPAGLAGGAEGGAGGPGLGAARGRGRGAELGSAGRQGERRRRGSASAGAEVRGGAAAGGAPGPRAPHPSPGLQRAAGAGGGRPTGRRPRPQADFTLETSNAGPTGEPRGEVPGGTRQLTSGSPAQVHLGHLACTGTESSLFSHSPEGRLAGSQVVDGRNQLPGVHPSSLTSGPQLTRTLRHALWASPPLLPRILDPRSSWKPLPCYEIHSSGDMNL